MVSMAIKMRHASIEAAKRSCTSTDEMQTSDVNMMPLVVPPPAHDQPPSEQPFVIEKMGANAFSMDPRPALRAFLAFFTDDELARFIAVRVSQADHLRPPLYLRAACIEGLHDFLLSYDSSARYILPPEVPVNARSTSGASTSGGDVTPAYNVFSKLPASRQDPTGLKRRTSSSSTNHPYSIPVKDIRENCSALLVSIATLISFLTPIELRRLIEKRINDSQPPYAGAAYFLEFMSNVSISKGKAALDRRTEQRARAAAQRRLARGDAAVDVEAPQPEHSSMGPSSSRLGTTANTLRSLGYAMDIGDDELEDGETQDAAPFMSSTSAVSEPSPRCSDPVRSTSTPHDAKPPNINNNHNIIPKDTPKTLTAPTKAAVDEQPKVAPRKRKRKRKVKQVHDKLGLNHNAMHV